jgi:hypothetical protein
MADLNGKWDTVVKSPMGDQASTLDITVSGDSFTGTSSGAQGSADIYDGKVAGDTLTWKMDMKVPMPMTLEGTATVDGDTIAGSVKAGAFGTFPLSGKRAG